MEEFHDFIKRVFDEQYEACFGSGMLEKLEPQDYYLKREEDGQLIALPNRCWKTFISRLWWWIKNIRKKVWEPVCWQN